MRCPLVMSGTCDREPAPAREMAHGHIVMCQHDEATLLAAQGGT